MEFDKEVTTIGAKLAFYKNSQKWMDAVLHFWTNGPYSHVELIKCPTNNPDDWLWYSASSRCGEGVRVKNINFKPENWDVFNIIEFDEQSAFGFIESQFGKQYDWPGLFLSQVISVRGVQPDKWFCSALVHKALSSDIFKYCKWESQYYSPNRLYTILHDLMVIKKWEK